MEPRKTGKEKEPLGDKKFVIEGQVRGGKIPGKLDLTVAAFSGKEMLASAQVNKDGEYRMEFMGEKPAPVELRLLPTQFAKESGQLPPGFRGSFGASRFVLENEVFRAQYDLRVSGELLLLLIKITKTYRMHGTVFVDNYPQWVQPLPGVKVDFYEFDPPFFFLSGSEQYLGSTQSQPDGSYEFEFDFSYRLWPLWWAWLFRDRKPDIRARISQFVDGSWVQVYESAVDWNITEDFPKDYFVPVDDYIPEPESVAKPTTGFRPVSVGLLPLDTTRIDKGYATAQPGDPSRIAGIRHQPFCGRLRIFGLFAETPQVVKYKVQLAAADEDGPVGTWEDLTDPLNNRIWDDTLKVWQHEVLGPDENNYYRNIDIEPEWDWHEHALKFTWNSANKVDDYYALRIIGYDAGDVEVHTEVLPIMRVDNTPPEIDFEVVGTLLGVVTDCGHVTLPQTPSTDRWIRVRVTAYDPKGHMLRYSISGTRGKDAHSAGATVIEERPVSEDKWNGDQDVDKEFLVNALPVALQACPSVAYNLELHAYGSPTDCYSVRVSSQHRKKETNMVVAE